MVQEIESLQQMESESLQEQLRDLEDQEIQSRQSLRETEADLARKCEELRYAEEELHRQRLDLQAKIKDREDDIQRLRNQVHNV